MKIGAPPFVYIGCLCGGGFQTGPSKSWAGLQMKHEIVLSFWLWVLEERVVSGALALNISLDSHP
jgi:hypothetical protein